MAIGGVALLLGAGAAKLMPGGRGIPLAEASVALPAPPVPEPVPGGEEALADPTRARRSAAPFQEPYFPFLDDEDASASVSVGDTTHGWLVNAKRLREGEACAILPVQRERDLAYGTGALVGAIERAASELFAHTKTRLWVGNIGRRGGGDIAWSVSHNSGRDADIAFAYLDAKGRPVDPPDLVPLGPSGFSKARDLQLDLARTWMIVKSFISDPSIEVQYLFLSEPLKKKLLFHARKTREPAALVAKADQIVKQPAGALAHDDHLHLRIYCGERDAEGGCADFGVVHPWVDLHAKARERRVRLAGERLADARAAERRRAVERLALLDAGDRADAVAGRLGDDAAEVRAASAIALGTLGRPEHVPAMTAQFARDGETVVRAAIVGSVAGLGGPSAGAFLAKVIGETPSEPVAMMDPLSCDDTELLFTPAPFGAECSSATPLGAGVSPAWPGLPLVATDVRSARDPERLAILLAAVDAAGRVDRLEPVEALLPLLSAPDPTLRGRAAAALARATNRSFGAGWDDPALSAADRDKATSAWRRWIGQVKKAPRDAWLASGFVAAGYKVPRLDARYAWELVRAVARGDHLAYNAHRALERITDHHPSGVAWSDPDACRHWVNHLAAHRKELHLERAPKATLAACYARRAPADGDDTPAR